MNLKSIDREVSEAFRLLGIELTQEMYDLYLSTGVIDFNRAEWLRASTEATLNGIVKSTELALAGSNLSLSDVDDVKEYFLNKKFKGETLSLRLRQSAKNAQEVMEQTVTTHLKAKTTWTRLADDLTNRRVSIGDLPKHLRKLNTQAYLVINDPNNPDAQRELKTLLKQSKAAVEKLAQNGAPNKRLKASYQKVIDAVEKGSAEALQKQMAYAMQNKAIYNNERISRTELARANSQAMQSRIQNDPKIETVRVILDSRHNVIDECFPEDTMILTENGSKPIKDISAGDLVYTHNGRLSRVKRVNKSHQKNLIKVLDSKGHHVFCTNDHPFLTQRGWVKASDLQKGSDCIVQVSHTDGISHQHSYGADHKGRPSSPESERLEVLKTSFLVLCGVALGFLSFDKLDTRISRYSLQTFEELCGDCSEMESFLLANLDYPHLSFLLRFFSSILQSDSIFLLNLLRNLDCSPQYSHMTGNNIFGSYSYTQNLCHNAYMLSSSFGDKIGNICCHKKYGNYQPPSLSENALSHTEGIVTCSPYSQTLYALQNNVSNRKHYPFSTHMSSETCKFLSHNGHSCNMAFDAPWLILIESYTKYISRGITCQLCVVDDKVKTNRVEDVFNFEVEDDHSYIADGYIVHNCDMLSQADLYGLGKGVYPKDKAPMPPYHVHCLCMAVESRKKADGARFSNERATSYLRKLPNYKRTAMLQGGSIKDWREDLKGYEGELTEKPKALPKRLVKSAG